MALSPADQTDLTALAHAYAAAVDDRQASAVAELFHEDGTLVVPTDVRRTGPVTAHEGRAAIMAAVEQVARLRATFHAIVGVTLSPGATPDEATGRVACIAHHVRPPAEDGTATDETWHVVYRDRYRRDPDGWAIERRELGVRFRSTATVMVPEET